MKGQDTKIILHGRDQTRPLADTTAHKTPFLNVLLQSEGTLPDAKDFSNSHYSRECGTEVGEVV
jgi:hypothetical protein